MIFLSFPLIIDELWKPVCSSCALVISPLNSLKQDQVRFLTSIGIKAALIGEEQNDENIKKKELRPDYFRLCLGLRTCFWEVADGEQCCQVLLITKRKICLFDENLLKTLGVS